MTKLGLCLVLAGLLAACATPPEVRELADKTAANVGTISAHLRRLDQNSREIAEFRADNIAQLHAANTELRAQYEYDVELTKEASGAGFLALIDKIKAWAEKVEAIFAKGQNSDAALKARILDTQMKLDAKSKALAEIAQSLATLAKEDKVSDRVRFLKGYAQDLKKELDTAIDADDKSADAAKKLIKGAKDKLTSIK
jgi:hypothetical protein